ncbi:MAG: NUDIX hydrolase [Candidatus Methanofastidiosia archaeon]
MKEQVRKLLALREKIYIEDSNFKRAAVLIPLFKKDEWQILFTKRSEEVPFHKGEISFPGGSFEKEKDGSLLDTALRETFEEIGVPPEEFEILGELDDFKTITNFTVTPFVAHMNYPQNFSLNVEEIQELIIVPLRHLLDERNSYLKEITLQGKKYKVYFFNYKDKVIWGATGRILKGFLDLIRMEWSK